MDGRGRIAEPLSSGLQPGRSDGLLADACGRAAIWRRQARRVSIPLFAFRMPRGAGIAATLVFLAGSFAFGVVRGEQGPALAEALADTRDALANAAGFNITSVALAGNVNLTREDVLTSAGVTGRTSLLFLDATTARARLKANPWIAEATVLKLYPGRLHIEVIERQASALWQTGKQVSVISSDGKVVQPFVDKRFIRLPLVVGAGAETRASDFLAVLGRYPALRDQMAAAVLVGERRWNLRLKSGLDIKLPAGDAEADLALQTLARLDREKRILSRDLASIDLRLPDRATVRLSDQAAAAREDAAKARTKRKAGDA